MISNPSLFRHQPRGAGRPQVLLYGNGLERVEGQPSWGELLNELCAPGVSPLADDDPRWDVPFPLLYQLLSTPDPAPPRLGQGDITAEEQRLAAGLSRLASSHIDLLDRLRELGFDHILTTNYSYCLEKTFLPKRNFANGRTRSAERFCLLPKRDGKTRTELVYRLRTGYLANNADGSPVGLWHIHGEVSVPRGVIVGHDRYGRLLSRIQECCAYRRQWSQGEKRRAFASWPELFLFGDVYVVGFGLETCETDLWWLLRRKQRERYADGRVYYFSNDMGKDLRDRLLAAHGVVINHGVQQTPGDYVAFYRGTFDAIAQLVGRSRQ